MELFNTSSEVVCIDIILQSDKEFLYKNHTDIKNILDDREFILASHILSARLFVIDEVISSLDKYRSAPRYQSVVNKIRSNDPDIDRDMLLLILEEEDDDACVAILRNVCSADKEKLHLVDIEYAKKLDKIKAVEYIQSVLNE